MNQVRLGFARWTSHFTTVDHYSNELTDFHKALVGHVRHFELLGIRSINTINHSTKMLSFGIRIQMNAFANSWRILPF